MLSSNILAINSIDSFEQFPKLKYKQQAYRLWPQKIKSSQLQFFHVATGYTKF